MSFQYSNFLGCFFVQFDLCNTPLRNGDFILIALTLPAPLGEYFSLRGDIGSRDTV